VAAAGLVVAGYVFENSLPLGDASPFVWLFRAVAHLYLEDQPLSWPRGLVLLAVFAALAGIAYFLALVAAVIAGRPLRQPGLHAAGLMALVLVPLIGGAGILMSALAAIPLYFAMRRQLGALTTMYFMAVIFITAGAAASFMSCEELWPLHLHPAWRRLCWGVDHRDEPCWMTKARSLECNLMPAYLRH
jgi:hypothetical protein